MEETARENFVARKTRELAKARLAKSKAEARILKIEAELEDADEAFSRYLRTKRKNQKFKNQNFPAASASAEDVEQSEEDWF